MSNTTWISAPREWTASELRRMPANERDALLAEAADRAVLDYEKNRELTDFEAFGKSDLHAHSANTQPG